MREKSIQNRNIKIGLDLDGVIIDHTLTKIRLAKQFGYFLNPDQTSSEVMKKLIPLEIYRAIQNNLYKEEGLSSKPMKRAKEILEQMTQSSFIPYIISRRGMEEQQRKFAMHWLKNNHFFPPLLTDQIVFVDSDVKKNDLCKKLNINIYLDDKIKVLNFLSSVKYKILFDPYSHHYKNPPKDIKVVKTWPEFYRYLQKIKNCDTIN